MTHTKKNIAWMVEHTMGLCFMRGRPNTPQAIAGFAKRILTFVQDKKSGDWLMDQLGFMDWFPTVKQAYDLYTEVYAPAEEINFPESGSSGAKTESEE